MLAETGLSATVTKAPLSSDRMKKFYWIRSTSNIHFNRNRQYGDCHVYSRAGARLIRWVIGCTVQPKRPGDRAAIALPPRAQTSSPLPQTNLHRLSARRTQHDNANLSTQRHPHHRVKQRDR